jgi:hypothetical protein
VAQLDESLSRFDVTFRLAARPNRFLKALPAFGARHRQTRSVAGRRSLPYLGLPARG